MGVGGGGCGGQRGGGVTSRHAARGVSVRMGVVVLRMGVFLVVGVALGVILGFRILVVVVGVFIKM